MGKAVAIDSLFRFEDDKLPLGRNAAHTSTTLKRTNSSRYAGDF